MVINILDLFVINIGLFIQLTPLFLEYVRLLSAVKMCSHMLDVYLLGLRSNQNLQFRKIKQYYCNTLSALKSRFVNDTTALRARNPLLNSTNEL